MIRDNNIDYYRKRLYLDYWNLHGLISKADGGATTFAEGEIINSPTDTGVTLKEISTLGIVGLDFAAGGDILLGCIRCPLDLDPQWPVGFRLNWCGSAGAAANRGVTWIMLLDAIKKGVALATATTALDTPFVESLNTVALGNEWTARAIKNKIGLSRAEIEDGAQLSFSLECDIIDSGTCGLLGIELDYVPVLTIGGGSNYDRPTLSSGVK